MNDSMERRSYDKNIQDIQLKLERIMSYIKSELGGDGTQGNIHHQFAEIRKAMESHQALTDKFLEKYDHLVNGNGKPGLITRLHSLEEAHRNHQGNIRVIWIAVIGVVISSAWKAFLSIVK